MKAGFAGTGTANDKHILIDVILGILIPAYHDSFRLRKQNILVKLRVYERLDVLGSPPAGAAVLPTVPEFLRVLRLDIDRQTYQRRAD